jgi:hypothetical protein
MMSAWESAGQSDEWYTPAWVFDALGERFDLDVAAPKGPTHVPACDWFWYGGLEQKWKGYVWMNPPFGGRNGLVPWLDKFFEHGNGIALTPDRTSAPWWQDAARRADAVFFFRGKIKFERPDGSVGKHPGHGTTLFAAGKRAEIALSRLKPEMGILLW